MIIFKYIVMDMRDWKFYYKACHMSLRKNCVQKEILSDLFCFGNGEVSKHDL